MDIPQSRVEFYDYPWLAILCLYLTLIDIYMYRHLNTCANNLWENKFQIITYFKPSLRMEYVEWALSYKPIQDTVSNIIAMVNFGWICFAVIEYTNKEFGTHCHKNCFNGKWCTPIVVYRPKHIHITKIVFFGSAILDFFILGI